MRTAAARLLAALVLLQAPTRSRPSVQPAPLYMLAFHSTRGPVDPSFAEVAERMVGQGNLLHLHAGAGAPFRGPGSKWQAVQRFVTANTAGGLKLADDALLVVADAEDVAPNMFSKTTFHARVRAAVRSKRHILFASEGCVTLGANVAHSMLAALGRNGLINW